MRLASKRRAAVQLQLQVPCGCRAVRLSRQTHTQMIDRRMGMGMAGWLDGWNPLTGCLCALVRGCGMNAEETRASEEKESDFRKGYGLRLCFVNCFDEMR
jgi:hypothetical protein